MSLPRILIAGGHGQLRERVTGLFDDFDVISVPIGEYRQVSSVIKCHRPSIALCITSAQSVDKDYNMMEEIGNADETIPFIIVTAHGSESLAVAAIRAGASDYFKDPFSDCDLRSSCRRLIRSRQDVNIKSAELNQMSHANKKKMVGVSQAIRDIKTYIEKVTKTDSTVLITGETGTGKELAADLIHMHSCRKLKPFIKINCSSLPEGLVESELFGYDRGAFTGAVAAKAGKFEMADGGSLFLDEIGEMQPYAQTKILRCIENKTVHPLGGKLATPVNTRVIAATNQDPEALISEGKFREDLYYRLNVARLHIPPLRERREDILELINFGINKLNRKFGCQVESLREDVAKLLLRYDWPGNVRELMNILEGTFINMPDNRIKKADLPAYFKKKLMESQNLPSDERKRILAALLETNWNKSTAAAKLKWSRMTLYRKMHNYHIVENRKPVR